MTRIEDVRSRWEELGRNDPLWAVLTEPGKRGKRWDPEDFLATGRADVAAEIARIGALGLDPPRKNALDFGCGAGRLTQALASHFETVYGVDVAISMIEKANELKRLNPGAQRCRFVHNPTPDLSAFETGSIDFVLSHIVLQHIPPPLAFGYIAEFFRVLSPGGVIVFGLPSAPRSTLPGFAMRVLPVWIANAIRRRTLGFEMYGAKSHVVRRAVEAAGGRIVNVDERTTGHWIYCVYALTGR